MGKNCEKKLLLALLLILLGQESLALSTPTDARTSYPIVLIHGLFGYGDETTFLAGYWGDIPEFLRENGAQVYIAEVSQAHGVQRRGEQLYEQLLEWGHKRYNLIGHSHGGLDARYILERYPDLVASVTTIGTPHRGSKVADYLVAQISGVGFFEALSRTLGDLMAYIISALSGNLHEQNIMSALNGLTTEAAAGFNSKYAIGMGKKSCSEGDSTYLGRGLYSWGSYGVSPQSLFDLIGNVLAETSDLFDKNEKNDGLVAICSMKFGKWLGAREGSHHLVPVGGVLSSISEEDYSWALDMFLNHAKRLKTNGF